MNDQSTGNDQSAGSPAEVYEKLFVPALFQQWGQVGAAGRASGRGCLRCAGSFSRLRRARRAAAHRLFGEQVAESFRTLLACGNPEQLLALCADVGAADAKVVRHDGAVRFASIQSLVSTERACVWTLGGLLDEAQFDRLLRGAEESLRPFVTADGSVAFVMPALIVTATKA